MSAECGSVYRMKNLYDPSAADEIQQRLGRLRPDNSRAWGKMNQAQMLAHCANAMEMAVGDMNPPRSFIGRLIGGSVRKKITADDAPLGKNSPTAKELIVRETPDFETERTRLRSLIDRFCSAGAGGCSKHPHTFFGPMTPDEWSILMYKHLDHHFRQFNA